MCSLAQYIATPRKPKRLKILTSQHGPKQAKQPLKLIKPNSNLVVFVNFTTELNSFSRNGTACPAIRSYLMRIVWAGGGLTPQKSQLRLHNHNEFTFARIKHGGRRIKKNTHPFKKQGHAKPNKILNFHSSGFCKIHVPPKEHHMWRNPWLYCMPSWRDAQNPITGTPTMSTKRGRKKKQRIFLRTWSFGWATLSFQQHAQNYTIPIGACPERMLHDWKKTTCLFGTLVYLQYKKGKQIRVAAVIRTSIRNPYVGCTCPVEWA